MDCDDNKQSFAKVVLVTGAARRIGATITRFFHDKGFRIVLHYHTSEQDALALANELQARRADSCLLWQCDLADVDQFHTLNTLLKRSWQRLDVLVNNASQFYRTCLGAATISDWDNLFDSNVKGAYFLTQAMLPMLQRNKGCIVNVTDIHGMRPMHDYSLYCMAKAALIMMTKALAKELAPDIRVNAVAPGVAAMPEGDNRLAPEITQKLLERIPLRRFGNASDIAQAIWSLVEYMPYVTGQVIAVDGGRSLRI